MKNLIIIFTVIMAMTACSGSKNSDNSIVKQPVATHFDTDSAMSFLKTQTDFGPRVPGTEAHRQCGQWLTESLQRLGADTVMQQHVEVKAWNGDLLPLTNIYARIGAREGISPILLVAHWDTRPWADAETDPDRASRPIDGANDGASGVAVILEIARQLNLNKSQIPVDILLVDGEDYGAHGDQGDETSWCLGTQAWVAQTPYNNGNKPRYAILLDMVGGQSAVFHREYISDLYAPAIVDMVWSAAADLGLTDRFVNARGGAITDDHLFLNRAGIPSIDIIESINPATGSFNPTWHTLSDTYDNIDRNTINDTGRLISFLTIK